MISPGSPSDRVPPDWPSQFPVPSGAEVPGSGSLGGSSSATLVAAYTTSESAPDAFAFTFYEDNSKLTTSDQKTAGAGERYVGSAKITAPYTGSVTVVSHSGTTYIVIVLRALLVLLLLPLPLPPVSARPASCWQRAYCQGRRGSACTHGRGWVTTASALP